MTHALFLDGAWRAVPSFGTITNASGIAVSADTFALWSNTDRQAFGARLVPDPASPPAGKVEASRVLAGTESAGPKWAVTYVDAPEPAPEPVPSVVEDWQFAGQAAEEGIITHDEALDWSGAGVVPPTLVQAVNRVITDAAQRFKVMIFLRGSKSYPRNHRYVPMLGQVFGKNDDAALDAFWIAAGQR